MSTEWLKGCEVCNAGLCKKMDALIESGLSQRKAALSLESEQKETLGQVVYSASALRSRYFDQTGKRKSGVKHASSKSKTEVDTEESKGFHEEPIFNRGGEPNPNRKEPTAQQLFKEIREDLEKLRSMNHDFWEDVKANTIRIDLDPKGKALFLEFVKAGYREMAKKYHSDHGGSDQDMVIINLINAYLNTLIK